MGEITIPQRRVGTGLPPASCRTCAASKKQAGQLARGLAFFQGRSIISAGQGFLLSLFPFPGFSRWTSCPLFPWDSDACASLPCDGSGCVSRALLVCGLPVRGGSCSRFAGPLGRSLRFAFLAAASLPEIGRASCRERV